MEPRISILTFPQFFDGRRLDLRILIVPRMSTGWNADPLQPVILDFPQPGDKAPPFADADLRLEARAIDGLDRFPVNAPVDFHAPLGDAGVRPDARKMFQSLVASVPGQRRFTLSSGPPRLAEDIKPQIFIKKYLPRSYQNAFLFTGPRTTDAVIDDSYQCAIKASKDPNPFFVATPDEVSWGKIYAYCLRHQRLAELLGLIRAASFDVAGGLFDSGGFLYVDVAADSAYAEQSQKDYSFIKRYAARIPPLEHAGPRQLFAATLFPVLYDDPAIPGPPPAPGDFAQPLIEAADYDDGFAKIVHGFQPLSQNILAEEPDGFHPVHDIGIRLGWDDEQVLIWQNRQLKADSSVPKVGGQEQRLDAPMGVFGYRIDARLHASANWHTLMRVRSKLPLQLDGTALGLPGKDRWEGELAVEVHPQQLDGNQATGQFWLNAYFAQWNGKSPVLPDEDAALLFKTEQDKNRKATLGRMYDPVGLEQIPLRYGQTYDLRVRLVDPTGGGPDDGPGVKPIYDSPSGMATVPFRRHVVFEPVRIEALPKVPVDAAEALFMGDALRIKRPLLGYPSVVFTNKYSDPIPLLMAASDAAVGKESFGLPDPDAQRVRIDVELRTLRMDDLLSLSGQEPYIAFYSTYRDFPADFNQTLEIPLEFLDAPVLNFQNPLDLGDLREDPSTPMTQNKLNNMIKLPLPRARDIRLTIRAVASENPTYFAEGAHIGKSVQVRVRREATVEDKLLIASPHRPEICGIYLQPDPPPLFNGNFSSLVLHRTAGDSPAIIDRLADQLGVDHKGMTLVGKRGERVLFSCSRSIRNTLAPDHSSLTFAGKDDLVNHWLVALIFILNRDWTWDGLQPVSFEIFRRKHFQSDAEVDDNGGKPVGDLEIIPTAPLLALDHPQRKHTTLVFLDAVEPKSDLPQPADPSERRFPDLIELKYEIRQYFRSLPAVTYAPKQLLLPVTTPPAQIPRIVSAGLALSKYERTADYSSTEARRKFLWLEMEEPIHDPHDAYFIRLLGYAPDPLLSDQRAETFVAPEEPALAIDSELIRVIEPSQFDDHAGLDAMLQLESSATSDRHFLIALPPALNPDSPELFGFFTYELRLGHATIWSTAQGRFGRVLRATGVQHPAPTLFCTCRRTLQELIVEAPYAQAVLNGKNLTADPPRTDIWALLYAQVRQADGKDYRNILLDDRKLELIRRVRKRIQEPGGMFLAFENEDAPARGMTRWTQVEILKVLRELGLPRDSRLSLLCVEMMPTLEKLRVTPPPSISADPVAAVRSHMSGSSPEAVVLQDEIRPVSDALGHFRILRTSPLTPAPEVCASGTEPQSKLSGCGYQGDRRSDGL